MLFDVHPAIDPGQIYLGCLGGIPTHFVGRCGSKLLNSHEFVVWDGQKPNSRGLCTQHKDSLIRGGMILPNQRSFDPYILTVPGSNEGNGFMEPKYHSFGGDWTPQSFSDNMDVCLG